MRIDNPQVSKLEFQPGAVVADSNFTGSFTGSFVGDATGASYTAPVLSSAAQGQARLTTNGTAAAIVDLGLQAADAVTFATVNTGQGANELYAMNQAVQTTNAVTFASVNTGQGVNELYAMNQDVKTTDAVTFATINTGQGVNELYGMNQDVKTTDAVTFATVNTGQGANELYDMNQNVKSDSSVTFDALTVTNDTIINGDLTVNGTTVSINATNLNVEDKLIAVASGSADSAAADGAGLFVSGAAASLTYTHSGTKWNLNKALDMGSNSISTTGEVAVGANGIRINGTQVTSTAANLNLVSGVTGTLVTEAGEQTLTNKTIAASQVTEISGLTAVEGAQLEAIGTTTISATQWGYLGATNQGLTATSDVQFNDVQVDSFGVGTAASGTTGEIRATGDITAYYSSDERLKENFAPLAGALDKVNQIGGYEFDWKEGIEEIVSKEGHDIGVKAQEVQAVYPELVHERDNGYLAVDYVKLTAVLIEAVKELSAKVDKCNCN